MGDQDLRQLETELKLTPDSLQTRINLLRAYLRIGKIKSSELADLAALADPGAIALVGKQPDLSSRTKKFYIRCALPMLNSIWLQLDLDDYQEDAQSLSKYYPDIIHEDTLVTLYRQSFDVISVCNQLANDYLNGLQTSYPIQYFVSGTTATIRHMPYVIENLENRLEVSLDHLLIQGATRETTKLIATLNSLLGAYYQFSRAFTKDTKAHCDSAINQSVRAWDHFNQGGFWPQMTATDEHYFQDHAAQMLAQFRSQIIENWLPGYTQ